MGTTSRVTFRNTYKEQDNFELTVMNMILELICYLTVNMFFAHSLLGK